MRTSGSYLVYVLCGLLFMAGMSAPAQMIDMSNPTKLPGKTGKFRIIGKNNDGIVVRMYGAEDVIEIYGDDLRLITSKTIHFKNQDGVLQHIMLNKTGAVMFYLQQDKKVNILFAQPVNSKLIEIGKPIPIDTIIDRKDLVSQNLRFKQSPDQSNLLIYYPFFVGNDAQTLRIITLNQALERISYYQIPFAKSERELEEMKTIVDNEGNSYIIIRSKERTTSEKFEVYRSAADGSFQTFQFTVSKKIFGEHVLEFDHRHKRLVLTALFDDETKGNEDAAHGLLYVAVDAATGAVVNNTEMYFPRSFIQELTGRDPKDSGKLYTFNIRKTILRNDGGALILAESFIRDLRETVMPIGFQPGMNTMVRTTIYQYNDVVGFSLNASGNLDWYNIMRKKQVSEDDNGYYSSFIIMNRKEQLHFVYLDEISYDGACVQYTLKSTGTGERKPVFNQSEKDVMLLPKLGKQISPCELVIPSYRGGYFRLVKFVY
ncbi:MAG: hypothetical protein NZM35_09250 [Chitinophagales bacterium]|nr:hypothetical protein [Chitinophagales bacterium]MDW8419044.1 hypothetical protein [Chitinophagales bacterium]